MTPSTVKDYYTVDSAVFSAPNHQCKSDSMTKTEYVVGFMFSHDKERVALIHKLKPEWQKGKLNGIGGKVKPLEDAYAAMVREFKEEAGVEVRDWRLFCLLKGTWGSVHFFTTLGDLSKIMSMEEEKIGIVPVNRLGDHHDIIPNLSWLIPLALDKDGLVASIEGTVAT